MGAAALVGDRGGADGSGKTADLRRRATEDEGITLGTVCQSVCIGHTGTRTRRAAVARGLGVFISCTTSAASHGQISGALRLRSPHQPARHGLASPCLVCVFSPNIGAGLTAHWLGGRNRRVLQSTGAIRAVSGSAGWGHPQPIRADLPED